MCDFGVPTGKLLGFIVSHRGIEANPKKINAIMAIDAPATIKDVQKLTGCMAALNRFLSRLGEWWLPFKLLKRQDKFEWTTEAAEALETLSIISRHRQFLQLHYQEMNYSSTSLQLLT